ncbi:MAG: hypothetical protein ACQEXJ_24145 [Myxococcota bacterium]
MRAVILGIVLAVAVSFGACKEGAEEGAEQTPTTEEGAEDEEGAGEAVVVEVPAEGKEFDPAIEVTQVPEGAWYCDMGTVHWAQMEEGEGRCPVCKMKLVKKLPQAGEGGEEEGGE